MIRPALLLAMIPLALMGTLTPEPRSPWTGVKPSTIAARADTFRQRFEAVYPIHTFEQRWWPGEGLAFDERWSPIAPLQGAVRTIRIAKPPPEPPQEAAAAVNTAVPLPPVRLGHGENSAENRNFLPKSKPRPIRVADLCARHGMVKQITNGGKSWRCKK